MKLNPRNLSKLFRFLKIHFIVLSFKKFLTFFSFKLGSPSYNLLAQIVQKNKKSENSEDRVAGDGSYSPPFLDKRISKMIFDSELLKRTTLLASLSSSRKESTLDFKTEVKVYTNLHSLQKSRSIDISKTHSNDDFSFSVKIDKTITF